MDDAIHIRYTERNATTYNKLVADLAKQLAACPFPSGSDERVALCDDYFDGLEDELEEAERERIEYLAWMRSEGWMPKDGRAPVFVQLTGRDGNIFAILGRAMDELQRAGYPQTADRLVQAVTTEAESYDEALRVIIDYVEVL